MPKLVLVSIEKVIQAFQNSVQAKALINRTQSSDKVFQLRGLIGSSESLFATSVFLKQPNSQLFILPDHESALYFAGDLENISGRKVLFFPSSFRKPFEIIQPSSSQILQRAETLSELYNEDKGQLIVTYTEGITERVINQNELAENALTLKAGMELEIDTLNQHLYDQGFERTDFVYQPGEFAIRGGIVDIFSFSYNYPYRLEFFGNELESIRSFEVESQLSKENFNLIHIIPNIQSEREEQQSIPLFNYLNRDTQIWIKEAPLIKDKILKGREYALELWENLSDKDKELNKEWKDPKDTFIDLTELNEKLMAFDLNEFGKQFSFKTKNVLQFNLSPQPSFHRDFNLLAHNLIENTKRNIQNYLCSDSSKQINRLQSIFEDMGQQVEFSPVFQSISEGFISHDLNIACYTDHQIFNRFYKNQKRKGFEKSKAITLKELRDLKPGDFVTHIDHGIGKYAGLEKVEVNGKMQENIRLLYADNDLLYVNINSLNRISKYSGKEGTTPKLNKLGSDAWDKLKRKTKSKVKDIARDLIKLYAQRKSQTGNAFSPDTYLQNELEASFIYEDTPDQEKATADVKADMESPHPMDRLVCGDVGFGKTEVAIRAAFKAVADSKQVAVLVPTTILAMQHYRTFEERLKDFPCNIDYINRFKTSKQIKESLKKLKDGKIDIIIGTHRLVSKDVQFKDLGLLVIDEEQKFGVSVKEKLKALRANVDCLTLSATPIPRTLHFSLMGARDLSIISTPPPNRQPVQTELHVFNENLIQEAVNFEVERNGQVFFIHNRVADLPDLANMIKRLVPDAEVGIAHGQLDGDKLESVMMDFINHRFDVLVATTIIEAGLDIPNANTIIINDAHMFGLSDLHQMRGRVGRSNTKAFCYLLSPPLSTLTTEAYKRLSAVEEFSDLGSGFQVAMRDLDIRGSGNLLGAEQSGFIAEIGFETYNQILDEAVQELKDDEFKDLFKDQKPRPFVTFTQIDTDIEALIPDQYVTNSTERYNLYSELAKIDNQEELDKFQKTIEDRFGAIPTAVKNLFQTLHLQWLGKQIGLEKISYKKQLLRGYFINNEASPYFESDQFGKVLEFVQSNPTRTNLKQVKGQLRIAIEGISSIQNAIATLNQITHQNVKPQ
ncbi:MAG TPA: transcription-repair coupling factor [Candidatus Sphingobacterium stercoripullorum]|nr:transcription-repair coupling factor [Candidatus Sphingobacterium stercoripullorum]